MFVLLPLYNMLAGKYNKAGSFHRIYSSCYSYLPMLGWVSLALPAVSCLVQGLEQGQDLRK